MNVDSTTRTKMKREAQANARIVRPTVKKIEDQSRLD
jgi:hypothetical protein